jgi:predicted CXXCH cytochrome family protein
MRSGRWAAPMIAGVLLVAGRDALAQSSCVTAQCHATILTKSNVHPPSESCDSCHESVATPHPQKGSKTFKLTQEPPELCTSCHDAFGKKSDVHPPVKDGMCTTCHDPHASNEPKLLVQPMKDLCTSCHDDKANLPHMHGPVSAGDCMACHTPHESEIKPLLLKKDDELCMGCHVDVQELVKKPVVHPALDGGCTSCHNPHGSTHPKLLADEGSAVCFACHDVIGEKIEKGPVVHAAIKSEKGCASCHSPHASDNAKLLLAPEKDTCLSCHKTIIAKNMTTLHGPINEGKCTPCHDPHGGPNAKLLVASFSSEPYVPYTDTEYALCFSCHKRDLVQYPDTSFATGFRDGERNLHYLHVNNKQKGRSCKMCHSLHGSTQPKLVADSVPFGKWNLPVKFVKTETGGSCAPGCHKMQSYDRKNPGKKPETAK